ncbi:probable acyl-activating enzyme 16, chloroplastic [Rutidosis leptorrhynchoides]|uniref:probable acyl-activating enzyme 16, chloroplastic n=1 Tax=Rutidosis leptorrhynchoides TaxID=125765 RepID=UPI003A9996AE
MTMYRSLLNQVYSISEPMSIVNTSPNNIISMLSYIQRAHPICYLYRNNLNTGNVLFNSKKRTRDHVNLLCNRLINAWSSSPNEKRQVRKYAPLLESSLLLQHNESTTEVTTIPDILRYSAEKFSDKVALVDPHHDPPTTITYKQLEQNILDFSEGLRVIGLKPSEKIALFAENSCRWIVVDQGIMATGAINVVRGCKSSVEELLLIYKHSESVALAIDNPEFYNQIAEAFNSEVKIRFVILLWGETSSISSHIMEGVSAYSYKDIMDIGREHRAFLLDSYDVCEKYIYEPIKSDDVATLIYTSGTTGSPKGVMLTHNNFLFLVRNLWELFSVGPEDRYLSMLPPWHAYERSSGYHALFHGVEQMYTTIKHLKDDLRHYQPHYILSVPLVYQNLYSGIMKQIYSSSSIRKLISLSFLKISMSYMHFKNIYEGNILPKNQKQPSYVVAMLEWLYARVVAAILLPLHLLAKKVMYNKIHSSIGISRAGMCGGGSLPLHVDRFFEAIGIKILAGYGLTESSPTVAGRGSDCNVLGSVGRPIPYTEIKVVNEETGEDLPPSSKGIIIVKGPQVMKGYYKNPIATKQALDKDGWLYTGDIGWISPSYPIGRNRNAGGVIVLEGRAKDTIVLSTGENVEPEQLFQQQLEEAAMRSSLIQQIVVIGQDRRRLGAIIVPNKEEIMLASKNLSTSVSGSVELNKEEIAGLLSKELRRWTSECSFQIGAILVIEEPFTIESGLMTATMKIRRNQVMELYRDQINDLYK